MDPKRRSPKEYTNVNRTVVTNVSKLSNLYQSPSRRFYRVSVRTTVLQCQTQTDNRPQESRNGAPEGGSDELIGVLYRWLKEVSLVWSHPFVLHRHGIHRIRDFNVWQLRWVFTVKFHWVWNYLSKLNSCLELHTKWWYIRYDPCRKV